MNRKLALPSLLSLCLLAVTPLAMANEAAKDNHMTNQESMDHGNMHSTDVDRTDADRPGMNQHGMDENHGGQHGSRAFDPVQRAEKHLRKLERELKLSPEQQSAWQSYSKSVMNKAQALAERMEKFWASREEMAKLDTASKLDKMAQWTRKRAEDLEQMAKDTHVFQDVLTPQQQKTFDEFWTKHLRQGKERRHN